MLIRTLKIKPVVVAIALLSLNALNANAQNELLGAGTPWTKRYTGQGLGGRNQLGGFVDSLIPIQGNANHLWFADGSFMAGRYDNYAFSLGSGLRRLTTLNTHEVILGGYFFGDYQRTRAHTHAWLANPGIELLTRHYEARIQGYIPMSDRQQPYQYIMASDIPQSTLSDSGMTNYLAGGHGHSFIDTPVALVNEFGNGVEGEVGRYFPFLKGGWVRGGVYHFDYKTAKSINGVEANIELYMNNNASLIVQNNYDNQNKNKFSLGIRYSFGGPNHTDVNRLSNRMEEPIIRHIARQSYGLASPVRNSFVASGPTQLLADNVWFFSPQGSNQWSINLNSCTAENPCLDLYQGVVTGINAVAPNASLWFASGTYQVPTMGADGFVNLYNGQSIWGRTYDFRQPASGNARPEIVGGLWWTGNGLIHDVQVTNNNQIIPSLLTETGFDELIAAGATGNINVYNSAVTATGSGAPETYAVFAGENAYVNNTTIFSASLNEGNTYGIYGKDNVLVTNSNITSGSTGLGSVFAVKADQDALVLTSLLDVIGTDFATLTGVYAEHNASLISSIMSLNGLGEQYGIYAHNNGTTTNSSLHLQNSAAQVYGLYTDNDAIMTQSTINVESLPGLGSAAYGISAVGNATINNSFISVASDGGLAYGISAYDGNVSNSTVSAVSEGNATAVSGNNGLIIDNSIISAIANQGQSVGVSAYDGTVMNSIINTVSEGTTIAVSGNNSLIIDNSSINATSVYETLAVFANDSIVTNSIIKAVSEGNTFGVYGNNNLMVGNSNIQVFGGGFAYGVQAFNNATVDSSNVSAVGGGQTVGILAVNGLTITNSISSVIGGGDTYAVVSDSNTVIIDNSTVKATGGGTTYGVYGDMDAFVTNSTVTANGGGEVVGIAGFNRNVVVTNSVVNASGDLFTMGILADLFNSNSGNATVTNSTINVLGGSGEGYGVYAANMVVFEGNEASHVSASGDIFAIPVLSTTVVNNSSPKSQCSSNGGPESDC
ncbi:beta strand repeat-containing protein [Legionella bozemanae]|uniref:Inverse autotransporter beta-domain domain-containing protein n=1 Tax=Legionella bozemanae TaxID=447 RepID=A0A0W0RY47_LEGBO|nr:hypothetical protein [Legionella bozemanae]KTC75930.1 hypothetical protein Lboz_0758 [Legionella bozemanae]STO35444.1 Uncharacterised protein [Legionella bozemanae]